MTGEKPDERIRVPMQWSAENNAGFTAAEPWEEVNPDYVFVNVQSKLEDPGSILSRYCDLIGIRNDHEALRKGQYLSVDTGNRRVYGALRYTEDEAILILINLSNQDLSEYSIKLNEGPLYGNYRAESLLGNETLMDLTANLAGGFDSYAPLSTLSANGNYVILLEPLP